MRTRLTEKSWFVLLLILALTFISFIPSLKNGFITTWDDAVYVISNPIIQHLNLHTIKAMFTTPVASSYVPVPLLSFAIEYKLFGLHPAVFHLTNLLLHLLCVALVYHILKKLKLSTLFAALGAALFGVHPMHVESVVWISERKDLLFALFSLASIAIYFKYLSSDRNKLFLYLTSLLLFIIALFSKITAVTLPFSLLIIDYFMERPLKSRVFIEKIPFFLLSLIVGIAQIIAFRNQGILRTPAEIGFTDQIIYGFYALDAYILKFFIPLNLSAIYPFISAPGQSLSLLHYLSPLLALLLGYLIYRSVRHTRAVLFAALFFLVNIILMFQTQILTGGIGFLADRFSYLPYFGLCFLAVWAAEKLVVKHKDLKQLVTGVLIIICIIFTFVSFNRSKIWENDFTLWNDTIEKYPEEVYKSYSNRGIAFTSIGRWDDAISDFNRVIELDPKYVWGYNNRGVAYQNKSQWEGAVEDFSKAIEIDSNSLDAYAGRGISYGVLGFYDKAVRDLSKTIQIDPNYLKGYSNRGVTYANLGQWDKAIADYSKAIELDPEFQDAYVNRSIAYGKQAKWDQAIADGLKAIRIDPENAALHDKLGYYYSGKDDMKRAEEQFRKTLEIENNNFDAMLGLAVVNFRNGDFVQSKNLLDQAKNIQPKLLKGMEGIAELENLGFFKPASVKVMLEKMMNGKDQ
ncbi:MAG: tetratricopeptide repeat protein [Bacteroidetes bacterium]|nr:tetratricopeptide repeat protein [Bacteroidota bacterium]